MVEVIVPPPRAPQQVRSAARPVPPFSATRRTDCYLAVSVRSQCCCLSGELPPPLLRSGGWAPPRSRRRAGRMPRASSVGAAAGRRASGKGPERDSRHGFSCLFW